MLSRYSWVRPYTEWGSSGPFRQGALASTRQPLFDAVTT
jgi:hypothetical protein